MKTLIGVVALWAMTGCANAVGSGAGGGSEPASMSAGDAADPACARNRFATKACAGPSDCGDGPEYVCYRDTNDYSACGCVNDAGCGDGFRCTVQMEPGEPVETPGACVPVACPN